jgi:hypothetical protein
MKIIERLLAFVFGSLLFVFLAAFLAAVCLPSGPENRLFFLGTFCLLFLFLALAWWGDRIWLRRHAIVLTDWGVRRYAGRSVREEIAWQAVVEVTIFTTADGPFDEDVFFALTDAQGRGVLVPQGRAPAQFVETLALHFPDMDSVVFIDAMATGTAGRHVVWRKPAPATPENALSGDH